MKKIGILIITLIGFAFGAQSQEIADNAIGLRLGDNDGFGAEVSYQRAVGDNNRLEFDLGWRSRKNVDAVKLVGLYQWVWNIDGGFNWYAGPGAGIAHISFDDKYFRDFRDDRDNTETYVFLAGDVGIEYSFDFPLLLSLDFRPEFGFGDYHDDIDFDIALGVRYQF